MSSHETVATPPAPNQPGSVSEPPVRTIRSPKILPRHLDRSAIVYVRQSTPMQVQEHT